MTLEKTLDVLRNKELTFGCVVERGYWINKGKDYPNDVLVMVEEKGYYGNSLEYPRISSDNYSHNNIIGHPLTRGRLYHLYVTLNISNGGDFKEFIEPPKGNIDTFREIDKIIFYYGYDSSEIERMQNTELWNKLYPLLVEFAGYFNKTIEK